MSDSIQLLQKSPWVGDFSFRHVVSGSISLGKLVMKACKGREEHRTTPSLRYSYYRFLVMVRGVGTKSIQLADPPKVKNTCSNVNIIICLLIQTSFPGKAILPQELNPHCQFGANSKTGFEFFIFWTQKSLVHLKETTTVAKWTVFLLKVGKNSHRLPSPSPNSNCWLCAWFTMLLKNKEGSQSLQPSPRVGKSKEKFYEMWSLCHPQLTFDPEQARSANCLSPGAVHWELTTCVPKSSQQDGKKALEEARHRSESQLLKAVDFELII